MENMDKGLATGTIMGADSLAENIPNTQESICPICLSMPKSPGFQLNFIGRPWYVSGTMYSI